jgi:diguanylate cyclase (GGDEF)-like protein
VSAVSAPPFALREPRPLSKRTLAAVSYAIERFAARLGPGTTLVSTFQRAPYFRPMLGTYNQLAADGVRCTTAYVGAPIAEQRCGHVELRDGDPLVRVWAAVLVSEELCAYVVARDLDELAPGTPALEAGRMFDAEIGFDPARAVELAGHVLSAAEAVDRAHLDDLAVVARRPRRRGADEALIDGVLVLARQLEATVVAMRSETLTAISDPLTGVRNREGLRRWLGDDERLPMPPIGVLVLDLDGFKHVNDTHGHLVGDELLRRAAAAITATVRPADVVVRWGGDEFIVLCPGVADTEELDRIGARVTAAIAAVDVDGISVTASAGVQVCRHRPLELDEADRAMYARKRRHHAGVSG